MLEKKKPPADHQVYIEILSQLSHQLLGTCYVVLDLKKKRERILQLRPFFLKPLVMFSSLRKHLHLKMQYVGFSHRLNIASHKG